MLPALRSWVSCGVAGALMALAFVVPENLAANPTFDTRGHYTSKTPYPEPYREALEAPPVGYTAVMVQHLARHGSRLLSSPGDDDLALRLWAQARQAEALTDLGEAMEAVLRDIAEVHRRMGYGSISTRGVREHEAMAARLHARQREFLEAGLASGRRITVLHSGRTRAEQSARAFVDGLMAAQATLAPLIAEPEADPETVYFHGGSEAEDATAFRQYRASDSRLQAVLARLENDPRAANMARAMLEPLFQRSFVDDLESGRYRIQTPVDDDEITDSVSAAKVLYALYSIASNLDLDADVDLGPFLHPDAVAYFAYVDDAETFYERGPAFDDEDVTFRAARALLQNFFDGIRAVVSGRDDTMVVLRFSHAQALIPMATLLGIDAAAAALPADRLYRYEKTLWRTAEVSPMAANIQWDVFVDDWDNILVRMLHQERQVTFGHGCRAWGDTSYFYALNELETCLLRK